VSVPAVRLREANSAPRNPSGRYVLYWMTAARRLHSNFALDRALELCSELRKPLLILEAVRADYPWASDRIHRFILDGMRDNAAKASLHDLLYYPYVEPSPNAGRGLLEALASDACVVVTDDFPCFVLARMVAAAARKLQISFEAADSNGLLPLRAAPQVFSTAFSFRRFLHKSLPGLLSAFPAADPLPKACLPGPPQLPHWLTSRWPISTALLSSEHSPLDALPIDHSVLPAPLTGGYAAASKKLLDFMTRKFNHYNEWRNEPEHNATSGLSPYLHFGHISVHEVFTEIARREKWNPARLALRATGSREGWWNMSPNSEAFLDQLITWRELAYNFCSRRENYDRYDSLPNWALQTLEKHARDERAHLYSLEQFERAQTHDPLWNASQTQLVRQGRIHNYLRMLWGKKILEWSRSPQEAARIMIRLNNKYALDGRDPNSYSGVFWCLGRYDRPWSPERPVFGTVRYMSSENTARKFSVRNFIKRFSVTPVHLFGADE